MADGRVTQLAIEVLSQPTNVSARVTQDVIELLSSAIVPARVTQSVLEVLSENLVVPGVGGERADLYIWGPL